MNVLDKVSVKVNSLNMNYDGDTVLSNVSLDINAGETIAVLGHNGSGKTVMLECIEGVRVPTQGIISYFEGETKIERERVKQIIGVQLQHHSFFKSLKAREILDLHASFYSNSVDVARLMDDLDMTSFADQQVGRLSGGQKQKVSIAVALVNDPKILFLDEPTVGLDVVARQIFFDYLRKLKKRNVTIVLTTHYIDEIRSLCDRVAFMVNGNICQVGSPTQIIDDHMSEKTIVFECSEQDKGVLKSLLINEYPNMWFAENSVCVSTDNVLEVMRHVLEKSDLSDLVKQISVKASTIEDVIFKTSGWVEKQ